MFQRAKGLGLFGFVQGGFPAGFLGRVVIPCSTGPRGGPEKNGAVTI